MGNTKQQIRPVKDAFFVLDSEHLDSVESRLYGFTFRQGGIVESAEDLNGEAPEKDGAYIYIHREKDRITVSQDYAGCFGLYLFRKDGYFALGNSFLKLAEYIRERYPMTLNREYADYLLTADLCSAVYGETMIREISTLDRCAVAEISIPEKKLEIRYVDYGENTVDPGSAEGVAILDAWRAKWAGRIRSIYANNENIRTDLSGGFDSRETLALFLSSGIDLNRILVYSHTDQLHTHKEDFEIASEIAKRYGFTLNNQQNLIKRTVPSGTEEVLARSFYAKLGFHKQMYFKNEWNAARLFTFTGNGGECIRDYWSATEESFIAEAVRRCDAFSGSPEIRQRMQRSVREILTRSIGAMRSHFEAAGKPIAEKDLAPTLYRETRCRNHFGKQIVEAYLANIIMLSPLLDSDLYKLKLSSEDCGDRNLLSALIPERYAEGLLDIRFDSGRSVNPETVDYVRKLNSRYPCEKMAPLTRPENRENLIGTGDLPKADPTAEKPEAVLKKAFLGDEIRGVFESCYDAGTYRILRNDIEKRKYFPLTLAYVAFGIVKAMQDIQVSRARVTFEHYLADQAAQYVPEAEKPEQKAPQPAPVPEASFVRKVARRLKKTAKVLLHG